MGSTSGNQRNGHDERRSKPTRMRRCSTIEYTHPADDPKIVNRDFGRRRLDRNRLQTKLLYDSDHALDSLLARDLLPFDLSLHLVKGATHCGAALDCERLRGLPGPFRQCDRWVPEEVKSEPLGRSDALGRRGGASVVLLDDARRGEVPRRLQVESCCVDLLRAAGSIRRNISSSESITSPRRLDIPPVAVTILSPGHRSGARGEEDAGGAAWSGSPGVAAERRADAPGQPLHPLALALRRGAVDEGAEQFADERAGEFVLLLGEERLVALLESSARSCGARRRARARSPRLPRPPSRRGWRP